MLAATNFIEGGNFTSSDNSGGFASSGLVGWLSKYSVKKKYELVVWPVLQASAGCKVELKNSSTYRCSVFTVTSNEKAGSRGQRLSHRCPSFLVPFPACESYWASSEWGPDEWWLCPGGEGDRDEEQRSEFKMTGVYPPQIWISLVSILSVIASVFKKACM